MIEIAGVPFTAPDLSDPTVYLAALGYICAAVYELRIRRGWV